MINTIQKRFAAIAHGKNQDSSDEYYTLFHGFAELLLELLCRKHSGKTYKLIICPCDSETSIFRELEKYKDLIGNPEIIYSSYPDKTCEDYFDMDYEKEYGCKADEVLIFTNPPFKWLSEAIRNIKCDYLLFGSNAVGIKTGVFLKEAGVTLYRKNTVDFTGNPDEFNNDSYGLVRTCFYSNSMFHSFGKQYINNKDIAENLLFGKDRLERIV